MVYEGGYSGKGKRFALVCARFNELIVNKLLSGARDALLRHETAEEDIDVIWVPGAFEIPLAALKAAESGRYHAVITWSFDDQFDCRGGRTRRNKVGKQRFRCGDVGAGNG